MKHILFLFALALAACGGAPESSEDNTGSVSEAVNKTMHMNVRMGTSIPADPLRNTLLLSTDPNNGGDSPVSGISIGAIKTAGVADGGFYRLQPSLPAAFIDIQIPEYDALKALLNSAAAAGRQVVVSFIIANTERRGLTQWPVVGTPTYKLTGVAPVTVFMNVQPGTHIAATDSAGPLQPDPAHPTPDFTSAWIVKHGGFYEGVDTFTPTTQHADLFLNDAEWTSVFNAVNTVGRNTRVTLTYESSAVNGVKPLLGLPIFSLL